jgi:hypothetical protein
MPGLVLVQQDEVLLVSVDALEGHVLVLHESVFEDNMVMYHDGQSDVFWISACSRNGVREELTGVEELCFKPHCYRRHTTTPLLTQVVHQTSALHHYVFRLKLASAIGKILISTVGAHERNIMPMEASVGVVANLFDTILKEDRSAKMLEKVSTVAQQWIKRDGIMVRRNMVSRFTGIAFTNPEVLNGLLGSDW